MATSINDFASTTHLWPAYGPIETSDTEIITDPIDLVEGDGPMFAILSVGAGAPNAVVSGMLQGSANGSSGWADIPGAVFAEAQGNGVRAIAFNRSARFLRARLTADNDSNPVPLALTIGQPRKLF